MNAKDFAVLMVAVWSAPHANYWVAMAFGTIWAVIYLAECWLSYKRAQA